jgi:hypothetical protein
MVETRLRLATCSRSCSRSTRSTLTLSLVANVIQLNPSTCTAAPAAYGLWATGRDNNR